MDKTALKKAETTEPAPPEKPKLKIIDTGKTGKHYDELVTDYGKAPTEEMMEIIEFPEAYKKSFWLVHQETFFRLALVLSALTALIYLFL